MVSKATALVRRVLILCLVAACALIAVWFYAKHRVNEEIRAHAEALLSEHYAAAGFSVSVGAARLIEGTGIELRDVAIRDDSLDAAAVQVAHIDEVILACDARLPDILLSAPQIKHTTIRRLTLHAARREGRHWNLSRLFPLPESEGEAAPMTIEDSVLVVTDQSRDRGSSLTLSEINLTLVPETTPQTTDTVAVRRAAALPLRIRGSLRGEHVARVEFDGKLLPDAMTWSFAGAATNLKISDSLRQTLPREISDQLAPLSALQADTTLAFQVAKHGDDRPLEFRVSGKLTNGQINDARLPYPLTNLSADVYADQQGLRAENVTARSGLGTVELACHRNGYGADCPLVLEGTARKLSLDRRLRDSLPEQFADHWDKYQPAGTVNVDMKLTYDQRGWTPDFLVEFLDVSFAYEELPYRVEGCIGTVHWQANTCQVDLRALAAGRMLSIVGHITNPGRDFTGGVDIALDGPIPLDEKLLSALQPEWQQIMRAFKPRGMITVAGSFKRETPDAEIAPRINIALNECKIQHEKFPYPIERITGALELRDGDWYFHRLKGYNDSGIVTCEGRWTRDDEAGGMLDITFVGTNIALEDELRLALNPDVQQLWTGLRLRGSIDHARVDMTYKDAGEQLSLFVRLQEQEHKLDIEGRNISIEPQWLPYRMDDLTGTVEYLDGVLTLTNLAARHGRTTMSANGVCQFGPAGWTVQFEDLNASHVQFDDALVAALPAKLGQAATWLNLSGLLSIRGKLAFFGRPGLPLWSNWNLSFDIENGNLDCGVKLEHIHGGLRQWIGEYDGHRLRSRGTVAMDSVIVKGIQLTNVKGPIWIDDTRVALGMWARPYDSQETLPRVTADVFGGKLEWDAQVVLGGDSPFHLQTTLTRGSLAKFSREMAPRLRNIEGDALVMLKLNGTAQGPHTWDGGGIVRLTNAKIHETPVLLSLLSILSVRQPDRTAFTSSDMDFVIRGDHIYFQKLNFYGDAISLRGTGSLGLNRDIDLRFFTMIGRDQFPIITPLLGLASQQILEIRVDGTLDEPNTPTKKVLPGINETVNRLFPELANRPGLPKRSQPDSRGAEPQPRR